MVVKVDRESLRVLDQLGAVRALLPSQISNKLERRRFAVATDKDGTEVRNDDTVKEVAGEQRSGSILHIHRVYLFLQNRQQAENSGIFVVRNSAVVTVAAKGGRIAGPDLTKMNPAMQRGGATPGAAMLPPKTYGRDRLLGKTVTIRKGPYKGLLGIVKDTTDAEARIELHTKNKVITVSKEVLGVKDPVTGASMDGGRFSRGGGAIGAPSSGRGGYGGSTPRVSDGFDGSRTPAMAFGGKTPAWGNSGSNSGSRTPGWKLPTNANNGGRTPGWADGSRTTNPYADGSRTAYGGATAYGGVSSPSLSSSLKRKLISQTNRHQPGTQTPPPRTIPLQASPPTPVLAPLQHGRRPRAPRPTAASTRRPRALQRRPRRARTPRRHPVPTACMAAVQRRVIQLHARRIPTAGRRRREPSTRRRPGLWAVGMMKGMSECLWTPGSHSVSQETGFLMR